MSAQPAPFYIPVPGLNPAEDEAIRLLNDSLTKLVEGGGTDVEHYFGHLKVMLSLLISNPTTGLMATLDPALAVVVEGILIVGPALEKTLGDRDLIPRCPCGTCPNSVSNNQTVEPDA